MDPTTELGKLLDDLDLDQSKAIADVRSSDIPEQFGWMHGLDLAVKIANIAGRFPVPFSYWEIETDGEKPRSHFFAVLGTPEQVLKTVRRRLTASSSTDP